MTSDSVFASNFGDATSRNGEVPTSVIGIRSFCTLYGIFSIRLGFTVSAPAAEKPMV